MDICRQNNVSAFEYAARVVIAFLFFFFFFTLFYFTILVRVPWTAKRSNQSILKQVNSESCWKPDAKALILWPLDVNAGRVNIQE